MSQNPTDEQPVETIIQYKGLDDFTDSLHRKQGFVTNATNVIDEQVGDASRRHGRDFERLETSAILNIFQFNFEDATDVLIVNGKFDLTYNNRTLTQDATAGPMPTIPSFLPLALTSDLPDFVPYFRELAYRRKYTNANVDDIGTNVALRSQTWGIDVYNNPEASDDPFNPPSLGTAVATNVRDKDTVLSYKSKGFVLKRNKTYTAVAPPSDLTDMVNDFYWIDYFCDGNLVLTDLKWVVYAYNYVLQYYLKSTTIEGEIFGSLSTYSSWAAGVPSGADSYQPSGGYAFSSANPDTYWVNIQKMILGLITSKMRRFIQSEVSAGDQTGLVTQTGKTIIVNGQPTMTAAQFSSIINTYTDLIANNNHMYSIFADGTGLTDLGPDSSISANYFTNYLQDDGLGGPTSTGFSDVQYSYIYTNPFTGLTDYKTLTADWYFSWNGIYIVGALPSGVSATGLYNRFKTELSLSDNANGITLDQVKLWAKANAINATSPYYNEITYFTVIVNAPPLPVSPEPGVVGPVNEIFYGSGTDLSTTATLVDWTSVVLGRGAASRSTYPGKDGDTVTFASTTLALSANQNFISTDANSKPAILFNLGIGLNTLTGSPTTVTIQMYVNGTLADTRTVTYANAIINQFYCFSIKGYGNFTSIRPPDNDLTNNYDGWTNPPTLQFKLTLDAGTATVSSVSLYDVLINYGF